MAGLGSDLWAPAAVGVLKERVKEDVERLLDEHVGIIKSGSKKVEREKAADDEEAEDEEATTNGDTNHEPADSAREVQERRLKQVLFDALYIQRFVAKSDEDGFIVLVEGAGLDLDDAAMTRLRKNAGDYAKKTYLLFAMLA